MRRALWLPLLATLGIAAGAKSGGAAAREPSPPHLLQRVRHVLADEGRLAAAIEAGRERGTFCFYCHGEDGNSRRPHVPKLAGQNPVYLLDQIERFATGARRTTYMQALARRFTDEDKLNLVIYFSSQPLRPAGGDPALAVRGEPIYRSRCIGCHGLDGRGRRGYARLAGQQPEYLFRTLREFRDPGGRRDSPVMRTMVQGLSDGELRALAHYLASLR